ncbi:MAG: CoA ester lyase, partial [Bacilli bacterium]|nr:CoA ester lyase [Bacilli bacterium]
LLANFLNVFNHDYEVIVRINEIDHLNGLLDLEAIISNHLDTIMLPKARKTSIKKLAELLNNFEKTRNIRRPIKIIPLIELAVSLLEVEEIVSLPRVDGILLGAEDLTNDLEIERTKVGEEIFYPRSKIAYACRASGIDAIDTPFTDVLDEEGLYQDALKAKALGMTAKAAIHPNQIRYLNEVFSPSQKQIEKALKIMEAAKNNTGVFSLDGKMVDKPIIERSQKIIEKAKRYQLL